MSTEISSSLKNLLEQKVGDFLSPLENFVHKQTTTALLLGIVTLLTLILANLPGRNFIDSLSDMELGVAFHDWKFFLSLKEWIGNGLMTLFFFLIGLELKREILAGKLRDSGQVRLIVIAAIGGMVAPIAIYLLFNYSGAEKHGWAIPMETDTAFALGALSLLAKRISSNTSIFLAALAIFDDIGGLSIIALFYTNELHYASLAKAIIPLSLLFFTNIIGVRKGWVFTLLGIILWWYINKSGIHATLAGLLIAVAIPARTHLSQQGLINKIQKLLGRFEKKIDVKSNMLESVGQHSITEEIKDALYAGSTPLQRWEKSFINPVSIIVLPLFALFNAGIILSWENIVESLQSPVALGIIFGLVIGKPLGIVLFSFLGVKFKLGRLPIGMSFQEVIGAGMLAGIGFTMSIFITELSFVSYPELIESAKFGIIFGSLLSVGLALIWLYFSACKPESYLPRTKFSVTLT